MQCRSLYSIPHIYYEYPNSYFGDQAEEKLKIANDLQYYEPDLGVIQVSEDRWLKSQQHVRKSLVDLKWFNDFEMAPDYLGNVLDAGCGQYPLLHKLLDYRVCLRLSLLDPLLKDYMSDPACPFNSGSLCDYNTAPLSIKVEDLLITRAYDTVIFVNTLQYCQDAKRALRMLYYSLKPGGMLIFHSPYYDDFDHSKFYDASTPLKPTKAFIKNSLLGFKTIHYNAVEQYGPFNRTYDDYLIPNQHLFYVGIKL